MLFSERTPTYASCMTISGGRTEQHVIMTCCSVFPPENITRRPIIASDVAEKLHNVLFGCSTRNIIIEGFLPRHWLYEWFSQFPSCGTYSVLSRSPSIILSFFPVIQVGGHPEVTPPTSYSGTVSRWPMVSGFIAVRTTGRLCCDRLRLMGTNAAADVVYWRRHCSKRAVVTSRNL